MKRADTLAAQGDTEGKVVLLHILEAIEELQSTAPSGAVLMTFRDHCARAAGGTQILVTLLPGEVPHPAPAR